ncbi:DEAD/DEAH box helicase [Latilactobacillus curvatus]|uniref:DEAD/DEAH box helicase n=1 Tax=Latilactobacillus curvatus TaxID=28038 RepID=UPI000B61F91D|nr:DEAD/DEAH box helicase [Latilactobacillus curvatus]ASN62125.1 helicase [Latilactobacillus curvatus]MCT2879540.1 DEAD/DEAH box helicase [Latilactobacillus curvatus]
MYNLYDYQQRLVDKARLSLSKGSKGVLIVAPPGSGKSIVIAEIARLATQKNGRVLFFVHRQELVNQIRESFEKQSVDMKHTTIMTVGKVVNRLGKLPKPTLIICDESQHSKAKTYMKIFNYYNDIPRLGFSGSPWRMSGEGFDDVYNDMVIGPDVEWLIKNHRLAPYKYYSVTTFNDAKLKKSSTGDYTNNSITEAMKPNLYGDIVKTWKEKASGKRTIVYAHDIKHSKKIAKAFKDAGIPAMHADSKTPKIERDCIMSKFRSGAITVLCNVSLVDEGFSVNECECCIVARPTKSLVFNIQASMRCMRYVPGKIGIIIDHAANYTRFGLPNTPHKWTLKDREKKKKSTNTAVETPIKQCAFCFAVIPAQSKNCPLCGHEVEIVQTEIKVDETARIEKIESNFKLQADYIVTKKISELKSYEELKAYAKARGYKQGWIYFQAKNKGLIKGAK